MNDPIKTYDQFEKGIGEIEKREISCVFVFMCMYMYALNA